MEPTTKGTSRIAYTSGTIAIADSGRTLYVSGHKEHFSIGGFSLEGAINSSKEIALEELNIAPLTLPFTKINPLFKPRSSADIVTGMEVIDDQLIIITDRYYDASHSNKENIVIFKNRFSLSSSKQYGFYQLKGSSRAAGWVSKIPSPLSSKLDAIYLTGSASNLPINSRSSIGPSMYTWFPFFIPGAIEQGGVVDTTAIMSYSLESPLHNDLYNKSGKNQIWTELSKAVYGFISPDQKWYIVIGSSGGHRSGIGYKITQDNGRLCGGPCAKNHSDYDNYYWMYSMEDIIENYKTPITPPIQPRHYGKIVLSPFNAPIIGADFDEASNHLYLLLDAIDKTQSNFEKLPIVTVYQLEPFPPPN